MAGRDSSDRVCVWGRSGSVVLLHDLLQSHNVQFEGTIIKANAFSADGTVLVGYLRRPEMRNRGWVLRNLPPICGTSDFDGNGDFGTDDDIGAFFSCLGGNCCATCGTADFNGDGDTGTDQDIESFFRVLGGGPC